MSDFVTLRLDTTTSKRLDKLCKATGRSRAALAAEAVRHYVELNEWQIAAIHEGLRQAEQSQFVDHTRLKTKWEKRLAAALGRRARPERSE